MSCDVVDAAMGRPVGGSEYTWCRAVPGGTGIAVLAFLLSKPPLLSRLQTALHKLQNTHPILNSTLHFNPNASSFSFLTSPATPSLVVQSFDLSATSTLLVSGHDSAVSPFHQILEHHLNHDSWGHLHLSHTNVPVLFASIYELPDETWAVVLRLHVAACDRTTAASLLRELLPLTMEEDEGGEGRKKECSELSMAIEELMPSGEGKKGVWARGMDILAYSLNSVRLTNLKFEDTKSRRRSQVVRLQLNKNETDRVLAGCRKRGIKLCGALTAAGLMAAHGGKKSGKKYGVVTLIDCRSNLHPPLSSRDFGFYHSAILNTHEMEGGEDSLWDVAERAYEALSNSKKSNKHLSDMADLNLLMRKAMDNPGLTSSSSLRTSIMSVFEDTVIDNVDDGGGEMQREVGLEDFVGCASVHGVGPSIAMFDTIRNGHLDCVSVYPSPLHSRQQMQQFVASMKAILIHGGQL
ncbi:uncharacterized protein LOC129293611 [Prosopis cineraria]|uniref:uncharacterized protein LOC129293611 n=1 Tax=Prosopis cineraria TaxID=364024 RepID=UPI00241077A6|nr:uncharacterized protein LOC129293611 [Prosopis cineraria]